MFSVTFFGLDMDHTAGVRAGDDQTFYHFVTKDGVLDGWTIGAENAASFRRHHEGLIVAEREFPTWKTFAEYTRAYYTHLRAYPGDPASNE